MTHVTIAPHVLVRNIHQSAWKGKFCELLRLARFLHTWTNSWL
jgi:hypothetical protein